MKKALIALSLVAAASLWVWAAAEIPADKDVLKFESRIGTVTFNHTEHAERIGDCVSCHHKTEGDAIPQSCGSCHDKKEVKDEAPKLKDAFHDNCSGCHLKMKEAGEAHGPIEKWKEGDKTMRGCKECHIKQKT